MMDPEKLKSKLRPGNELHDNLVTEVSKRVRESLRCKTRARTDWREIDHMTTAYVDAESAHDIEAKTADPRRPVNVMIPTMAASLDMLTAYIVGTIMSEKVMYPLMGRGSKEAMIRASLIERVLQTQAGWYLHDLRHIVSVRDMLMYGISAIAPVWTRKMGKRTFTQQVDPLLRAMLSDAPGIDATGAIRFQKEVLLSEGSELRNIDPYYLLMPPFGTPNDKEEMEYIGYLRQTNAHDLMRRQKNPEEMIFNAEIVKKHIGEWNSRLQGGYGWLGEFGYAQRKDRWGHSETGQTGDPQSGMCMCAHMFWNLIPSEHGLGDEKDPETWMITVAEGRVIIQAERLYYDHGQIPLVIGAPTTTGHDVYPVSLLARTMGMQKWLDFCGRIYQELMRKSYYGTTIVDTSAFFMDDFKNPDPGKLIRLKRSILGGGDIRQKFYQFPADVPPPQHLQAMSALPGMINDILGTNGMISGDMRGMPDRPTMQGLMTMNGNAGNRLQLIAQTYSSQVWNPLSLQLACNTVQFMDEQVAVNILGVNFEDDIRNMFGLPAGEQWLLLSSRDLETAFEVQPLNRFQKEGNSAAMASVVERMLSDPAVSQQIFSGLNATALFMKAAENLGFDNIEQYRNATTMPNIGVMPDELIQQQAQAGNIVPATELM